MNTIKRITVICFAVLFLAANLPLCVSATDPVSAATMANALAQAITAYGASQGVSMTFDVSSTDGIGEGVHELWDNFKEDIQDNNVPTYDSLAVTMWADIYTKVGNYIGININDTEMPYIDAFWNWLLSGPAQLVRVDNEYYEWTLNQNDTVDPINVYQNTLYGNVKCYSYYTASDSGYNYKLEWETSNCYVIPYTKTEGNTDFVYCLGINFYSNANQGTVNVFRNDSADGSFTTNYATYGTNNYNVVWPGRQVRLYYISNQTANPEITYDQLISLLNSGATSSNSDIDIRPYIGDTTPQNVYIPDNEDVNYTPLPYVGGLDIPWDDSLFGDGSGTLTDAQSEAISGVIDDAITDSLEKTLTLTDNDNPDIPAPSEVYIPFLPVTLPNFNFSLSGIWHYVREWISSLGAWFTMVLTVWNNLPYAIVVPVYATMVILIVLGVYKRFFM